MNSTGIIEVYCQSNMGVYDGWEFQGVADEFLRFTKRSFCRQQVFNL
jgi:hypothetical protein